MLVRTLMGKSLFLVVPAGVKVGKDAPKVQMHCFCCLDAFVAWDGWAGNLWRWHRHNVAD